MNFKKRRLLTINHNVQIKTTNTQEAAVVKGEFSVCQMPLIQQKRDTSLVKELNHVQDRKGGLSKGFQVLQEQACYNYQPKTLSYLRPAPLKKLLDP